MFVTKNITSTGTPPAIKAKTLPVDFCNAGAVRIIKITNHGRAITLVKRASTANPAIKPAAK